MPCDEGLTSEALLRYIKDIMVRCSMDSSKMISMAFDGASAMKHLATLLKTLVSKHTLYIHCFAHCNELVFKDASSHSSIISDAQDLCETIYVLAGVSPKRVLLFENVQKELLAVSDSDRTDSNSQCHSSNATSSVSSESSLRLKNLSKTRWTTRGAAADVVLQKYRALRETLTILSTDRSVTADCRAKSEGILRKLQSFLEMFKLVVMSELASLLENNSKQLQSASLTAEQASNSIDKMCIRLDELRTCEEFERLITKVETITGLIVSVGSSTQSTVNSCQQQEEVEHHDAASPTASTKRKRKCPAKMTDFVVHAKTPIESSTISEKAELMRLFLRHWMLSRMQPNHDSTNMIYKY
jgi:hypothetical protein